MPYFWVKKEYHTMNDFIDDYYNICFINGFINGFITNKYQ